MKLFRQIIIHQLLFYIVQSDPSTDVLCPLVDKYHSYDSKKKIKYRKLTNQVVEYFIV